MVPPRLTMLILCSLCVLINYADRVNMSVAIIPLSEQFSYPLSKQSLILSSFFLGYLPMNLGGAILSRKHGAKKVLSIGAILWSLFTILTPIAASLGFWPLLLCRVFMGLAEGVAFPTVYHFLGMWIPPQERGRSVALFLTGVHVGTCVALVVSPWIIRIANWQTIFYIFGAVGYVWVSVWALVAYEKDTKSADHYKPVNQSDQSDQTDQTDQNNQNNQNNNLSPLSSSAKLSFLGIPYKDISIITRVFTHKQTLALCITQTIFSMIHYTILAWLPTYFKTVYSIKTTSLSFTFLPYFCMAISANIGGLLADQLAHSLPLTRVRKLITVLANTGAGISIILFSRAQTVSWAIALISASMAFMSLNSGGFESVFLDIAPPAHVGIVKATCNTLGSLAGFVAIPFSTLLLQWLGGDWRSMFACLSVAYLVKTIVFCTWVSSDRLWTDEQR